MALSLSALPRASCARPRARAGRAWTTVALALPGLALPVLAAQGVLVLPHDGARDETGSGRARVEVLADGGTVYAGQPLRVRLCFELDPRLLERDLIQIFLRPLGAPVQLRAPWLEDPRSYEAEPPDPSAGRTVTCALEDRVVLAARLADRVEGANARAVFEVRLVLGAAPAGELALATPTLRYAYATRFDDDLVRGRVPADRVDAFVRGEPLVLRILSVPEAGRPPGFTGAVGRFEVSSDVWPRDIEYGESLELALTIRGDGDLATFVPPRLDDLEGFLLHGRLDDAGDGQRTVRYDLAPVREDVRALPAFEVVWFDPGPPAQFRTYASPAVPILVRPARRVLEANDPTPAAGHPGASIDATPALLLVYGGIALGLAAGIAVAVGWLRRSRARAPRK